MNFNSFHLTNVIPSNTEITKYILLTKSFLDFFVWLLWTSIKRSTLTHPYNHVHAKMYFLYVISSILKWTIGDGFTQYVGFSFKMLVKTKLNWVV